MFVKLDEESLVELEGAWKLLGYLPNAFQELRKHGRNLFGDGLVLEDVSETVSELVAKHEPVPLDEDLKSVNRSVVGIEEERGQRTDL